MSETEKKALQRLRILQRQWRKARWFTLATGVLLLALSAYQHLETRKLFEILELVLMDEAKVRFVDLLVGVAVATRVSVWAGVFLVVFALARWRGSPVHLLLLRLFEDHAEE